MILLPGTQIGRYANRGRQEAEQTTASGSEAARFLVQSPDVPVISFTGSSKTGRTISAAGAAQLKRFSLELSGNHR